MTSHLLFMYNLCNNSTIIIMKYIYLRISRTLANNNNTSSIKINLSDFLSFPLGDLCSEANGNFCIVVYSIINICC